MRRVQAIGALGVLLVPAMCPRPAGAQQTPAPRGGLLRIALLHRELWGAGYPQLVRSVGAWQAAGEQRIIVAPDLIIGANPYKSEAEAARGAAQFRAALAKPVTGAGEFRTFAAAATPGTIAVRRYGLDGSYRVTLAPAGPAFAPGLRLGVVEKLLGKPERVTVETKADENSERRPLTLTDHVYAGGALVYQTSNYAPAPDSVFRVVLQVPATLRTLEAQ
jgi:hypothetical protein